jgi:hypothetical protein
MALKITSCIFVVSLAFGIPESSQIKDVAFDVNKVGNQARQNFDSLPTGEFLIDTVRVFGGPACGSQKSPSFAFDGTNYLVVWEDSVGYDIYGARVEPNGVLLDSGGIPISLRPGSQLYPQVIFGGNNYLVVWEDRSGSGESEIYGARVSTEGIVLDPEGIPITAIRRDQEHPKVIFGSDTYFVFWDDYRSGGAHPSIYGARVTTDGVVLDPSGIQISPPSASTERQAEAVFDGNNYFLVWEDFRAGQHNPDICGARVSTAGVVFDTAGIPIGAVEWYPEFPDVAFSDSNYLVVWRDFRGSPGVAHIWGARVSKGGEVLDPFGIRISTIDSFQSYPEVIFGEGNYFVVWTDERSGYSLYGTRVNEAGVVLDTIGFRITDSTFVNANHNVAFDGTNYFVIWEVWRTGGNLDIWGTSVSSGGVVLDTNGLKICSSSNAKKQLGSVLFAGTNYLVIWTDYRFDGDIYGARIDTAGTVSDPDGILITRSISRQTQPKIAFDGTNYFVVWTELRSDVEDIYGARVGPDGIVLDQPTICISRATGRQILPQVIFGDEYYLVYWEDYRRGDGSSDIYGTRVNRDGVVLDTTGIPISTANLDQLNPKATFDGTNYLVVWSDKRSGSWDIYGTRVSQTGTVLDPDGIAISTARFEQNSPAVAFDGTNYFVVWQDNDWDIYGARISQAGTVLDPNGIVISGAGLGDYNPVLAFDGTNYFVVWKYLLINSEIYGARVNPDGIVLDTNGFQISNHGSTITGYDVIFDSINYFVVWDNEVGGQSGYNRIMGARVTTAGEVLDSTGIGLSSWTTSHRSPQVVFNGDNYVEVWEENHTPNEWDIYGAYVNTSGSLIGRFTTSNQIGTQESPTLVRGSDNHVLIVYSGWTDSINNFRTRTMRIWGIFDPVINVGIEENNRPIEIKCSVSEIYPNPARSFLAVRLPQTADHQMIKIFDVSGKLVKVADEVTSPQSHKQELRISLKGINSGIYFLEIGKEVKKFLVVK